MKFRTFMLASFKHYLANAWNKEHALKRGGDREFVLEEDKEMVETLYASERASSTLNEEHYYEQCLGGCLGGLRFRASRR